MGNKFKIGCIAGVIVFILIVGLIVVGYIVNARNNMVKMEVEVEEAWAQVQNVYQRRLDLIPNLANSVRAYMKLEKDIFELIANARASTNTAESPQEIEKANQEINSLIRDIRVIVEDTPELKASETVRDLMVQLEGTENRIAVERRTFNEKVRNYNTYIRMWPRNVIARWFGFEPKEFFEAEEGAETAPEVDIEVD
ncbi:MAG: LemA family protein [Actinobacteria bacterium]|nr:LemA family protein [Actinomycetota bacterium]